jgi:hypothetical protein
MPGHFQLVEILGYIASALVAVSLMMKAIIKLRIINLIGSVFFTVYGIIIGAYPVACVNGFVAFINIYYLFEIFTAKEYFSILEVKPDSDYLKMFLNYHYEDITKYITTFTLDQVDICNVFFVLRNSVPAGLVCFENRDDNSVFVKLDYVIPGYRDFKTGNFVYNKILKERNIRKIYSSSENKVHQKYLKKMGFKKTELDQKTLYCLELK